MWATRSLAALLAAAACGAGQFARTARAHDSLAPPGSPHTWLPVQEWVHRHWLPFDERDLSVRLGLRPGELEAYLYNDHRALAVLATARGIDIAQLRDDLVAPWRTRVDERRYAVLRDRTERLLTQPHLAQHVFFHVFHGSAVAHAPQLTFGLPDATVRQLRLDGHTPIEIADLGGVSPAALRATLLHFFHAEAEEGIRLGFAWPAEARLILARQTVRLDCWMRSPRPGDDPANPYGKARFWHGRHARGWPASPRQRRANDRRVERFRRSLRRGCWPVPAAWSGSRPPWRAGRSG
jgi:hypothetical protein